jgi:hypothetical protein
MRTPGDEVARLKGAVGAFLLDILCLHPAFHRRLQWKDVYPQGLRLTAPRSCERAVGENSLWLVSRGKWAPARWTASASRNSTSGGLKRYTMGSALWSRTGQRPSVRVVFLKFQILQVL